ncbi:MAG: hypothetical protein AABX47_08125 [Nanoarchaeota archaeon]
MESKISKNKKLINFSELKEAVINNAVKNVPSALKSKERKSSERSLLEFN